MATETLIRKSLTSWRKATSLLNWTWISPRIWPCSILARQALASAMASNSSSAP